MRTGHSLIALTACGVLGTMLPSTCAAQATPAAPRAETNAPLLAIEKALEARRQELHVPGVAFAIVRGDRVIYTHGFGVRDVTSQQPVTTDTLFAIGSSTKAFTAMTLMMSADEGKLALTDSPKKYLPFFRLQDPDADQHITLSDILSHRSGLARTDMLWAAGVLNSEQLIRALADVKPTAKLGEKFQYQNLMYITAGQIVGKVQRTAWTNVVAKRIFRPLGMSHTDTSIEVMQRADDYALGYAWNADKQEYTHLPMRNIAVCAPAGAINSNLTDMTKWVRFMLAGGVWNGKRLVSEQNFTELTVPRITVAGDMKYGYGWFLRNWNGHKVVEHGGNIDGFNAEVALMPDQQLGFVMLTNVTASSLGETALTAVWENLVGKPVSSSQEPAPSKSVAPAANTADGPMKELVGPYSGANLPVKLEVALRNGKVALIVPGQPAYALVEKSRDAYSLGGLPADFALLVHRDAVGKVVGATLKQPAAQGDLELLFGNGAPTVDLPPIDEVMQKYIAAVGGEAALRRHHSQIVEMHLESPNQGVTGTIVVRGKAPMSQSTDTTMYALKKRLLTTRDYFDGQTGASESSLAPVTPKSAKAIAEARVSAAFYRILEWKSLYKTAKVIGRAKVGEEDCYIVALTPPAGNPTLEYLSTRTFLPVKQDTIIDLPGLGSLPASEAYSDYRTVDGVKIPFRRVASNPISGETISTVTRVRFDVNLPDRTFRSPATP
ncbi:MAG: hypothetical protein JWL77_655 [Chthonomonadaceae bacterium]|nr:hypothetical protein [Chthonomonadaceae bacterium]